MSSAATVRNLKIKTGVVKRYIYIVLKHDMIMPNYIVIILLNLL